MKEIRTVTVIGATGTMGTNAAGIFASFGNAKVYAVGRDIEKVKNHLSKIVRSVRADSIKKNLIPADDTMLEQCVSESDLVFESTVENIDVKIEIASRVARCLRKEAVSCTGTSGLSITRLAEVYPDEFKGHFIGLHMFNPPYSMPLCELIFTAYTDKKVQGELKEYLEKVLFRTVVEVKDSPAFLGNRIGFQFINEAAQYAERYKDNGGIDYIDGIIAPFTGRPMSPLVISDFVGLDVHKAIVDNLYENTNDYAHETFRVPEFMEERIRKKQLGRKSGCGLYQTIKYEGGLKRQTVLDIGTGSYRDKIQYVFPFAEKMKKYIAEGDYEKAFLVLINNHSVEAEFCTSFLLKYIIYSLYVTESVGETPESADDVMAAGFNWCPPFALCQIFSAVSDIKALIRERLWGLTDQIDIDRVLSVVKPSKYDYRSYFRSIG